MASALLVPAAPASAAGAADVAPNPLDFGTVQVAGTKLDFVTVTNTSGASVRVTDDNIDTIPAPFASSQEDSNGTIRDQACYAHDAVQGFLNPLVPPGESCRLYYRFSPTTAGTFSADSPITVYEQFGSPIEHQTVHLQGAGANGNPATVGHIGLGPTTLAFGSVELGQRSAPLQATVKNNSNGNVQVHISAPGAVDAGFSRPSPSPSQECHDGAKALVLAPQSTCVFTFEFAPKVKGAKSVTAKISVSPASGVPGDRDFYESETVLASKNLALSGTGTTPPIAVSPTSLSFGAVTTGGYKELSFVVTNKSQHRLAFDLLSPSADFTVVRRPPEGNRCLIAGPSFLTVDPGDTCTMDVQFAPSALPAVKAKLRLEGHYVLPGTETYANSSSPDTLVVTKNVLASGSGKAPSFTLSPASASFGNVALGATAVKDIIVTNTTTRTVQVHIDPATNPDFGITSNISAKECWYTDAAVWVLGPNDTCVIHTTFSPSHTGAASASLNLWLSYVNGNPGTFIPYGSHEPLVSKTLAMSGTGTVPTYTMTPSGYAFGQVTFGKDRSVGAKLKNTSTVPLAFELTSPDPTFLVVHQDGGANCMSSEEGKLLVVPPGGFCKMSVRLTPSETGKFLATLSLKVHLVVAGATGYQGPAGLGAVVATKDIQAKAHVVSGTYTITPSSFAFGKTTYPVSKTMTATLKNTSTVAEAYELESPTSAFVALRGSDGSSCMGDGTTMLIVHAGESCTLTVRYDPPSIGDSSESLALKIHYAVAEASGYWSDFAVGGVIDTKHVSASGQAVAPTFTMTPSSYAFGTVTYPNWKTITAVVKNTSDTAVAYELSSPTGAFQVSEGSNGSNCMGDGEALLIVHAGESCHLDVTYQPPAIGASSATLVLEVHYAVAEASGYWDGFAVGGVVTTKDVAASGTAVGPTYTMTPSSFAFGTVTYPNSPSLTTTLKNTSDIAVAFELVSPGDTFTVLTGQDTPFGVDANCMGTDDTLLVVHSGETCTLSVRYDPPSVGSSSATLQLHVHYALDQATGYQGMGVGGTLVTKDVTATGKAIAPTFTVTPSSLAFGNVTYGASKTLSTTVKNTSGARLIFDLVAPPGSSFTVRPGANGTSCIGSFESHLVVDPGVSCKLFVRYEPPSVGPSSATLSLDVHSVAPGASGYVNDLGVGPVLAQRDVGATGKGVVPTYTTSSTSLAFGRVPVGSSKILGITVSNTSDVNLAFDMVSFDPVFEVLRGPADGHSCMTSTPDRLLVVAPRSRCLLTVRYTPDALVASTTELLLRVHPAAGAAPGSYVADGTLPEIVASKHIKATGTGTP